MIAQPSNPRAFCEAAYALMQSEPLGAILGYNPASFENDGALIAEVLARAVPEGEPRDTVRGFATARFMPGSQLFAMVVEDVCVTAARDRDPGGPITSLLFANGLHNLLGYRLTHALYMEGLTATAHAVKGMFVRAFGADIMPQAMIGRRIWIDHGLGIVVGQTAVIEDDANLWHGVTLGTDLVARGDDRHPKVRKGAIIGATAQLIGPIEIGEYAVVAAGAIVTQNVPHRSIAVGQKARILEGRARSAAELGIILGELK